MLNSTIKEMHSGDITILIVVATQWFMIACPP